MSNEENNEIVEIESNGDFHLGKRDGNYVISDPNSVRLDFLETNGFYSFATADDVNYVLDENGNSIRLEEISSLYTLTNVEENPFDDGFLVLAYRNDKPEWNSSPWFNYNNFGFKFDINGQHVGSDIVINNNHATPRPGVQYEPIFGLDLNSDGQVASGTGSTKTADISPNRHHADDGYGSSVVTTFGNANRGGGWSITQVEESESGGFELFWAHEDGRFQAHKVDDEGNKQSAIRRKLAEHELVFEADLDGDGIIGFNLSSVETNGEYNLATASGFYHIVDESTGSIVTTFGNANRGGGWRITQVEESTSGGFELFWAHEDGRFQAHKVDDEGNKQSAIHRTLAEHELVFEADLDGDGLVGFDLSSVETNGDYSLATASGLYHIVDQSTGSIVTTFGNANRGGGWSITQVEESARGGFELFWIHENGRTQVQKIDDDGNKQSAIHRTLAEHELVFEADLDGDGL
ncbi:MAG: hypothetical protein CME02_04070, partial [Geminicoccus sp.]|nr:hypothetical protein [Geminicoccus sp.]